jgi:hypothetical protein
MRACTLAFFLDLESDWLNRRNSLENMGKEGEEGFFFLGYSQTTTFCLGFLYFIFYYNMGILVTLTLKR